VTASPYRRLIGRLHAGEVVVLDGGTGTELQRRGAPMDPGAWCGPATLGNDALLTEIHLDYVRAGAEVITANTFASSRLMLEPAGFGNRVEEINRRAVAAALRARDAAQPGRDVVVAGSLSHMVPVAAGTADVDVRRVPSDARCAEAYHELAGILKDAGVDHLMLEMMYHPGRTPLVVEAALATGLPVWFGLSARRGADGSVLAFHHADDIPLAEIARLIPPSADVAGVMHTTSDLVAEADAIVAAHFGGPRSAYPYSGWFEMPDWRFVDVIEPAQLEQLYRSWVAGGVRLIGGCCGLTVEHVAVAARVRDGVS